MNDKYQKALNKIVKSSCPNCRDENGCASCSIERICNATAKDWVNALQELIDQNKVYTLEEIKQMWEEKEYHWGVDPQSIFIYKGNKTIRIDKINLGYECYNDNNLRSLIVSSQEHDLITKSIKTLKKEVENDAKRN